jgi:AcrR family transcriptional regulator
VPRAGLTPERVVAEAAELIDAAGRDGLTLTALASRLGVAVPSLYKHVGGLDDLHRRLAARAVGELGAGLAAAARANLDAGATAPPPAGSQANRDGAPRAPRPAAALAAVADAYRAYALAHPGRYAATQRAPAPDDPDHLAATQGVLDTMSGLLAGYGIDGDDMVDAIRVVRSALHGFIALESTDGFGLPQDVERSYRRLVGALDDALTSWGRGSTTSPGEVEP